MTTTSIGTGTATLAVLRRQQTPPGTVRRSINYKPKDSNAYARDRKGLLGRLTSEFPSVDPMVLEKEIIGIEGRDDPWSTY